jgi:HEAT repeat protein
MLEQLHDGDARVWLRDPSSSVRHCTAWALGLIQSPKALPVLIAALRDPGEELRLKATWARGAIGLRASESAPVPAEVALIDPSSPICNQAFPAVDRMGSTIAIAVPILLQALRSIDATPAETCWSILQPLHLIAPTDPLVTHTCLDARHDAELSIRSVAVQTLNTPASKHGVSSVIEAMHGDLPCEASSSLGRIGLDHPAVVPALRKALCKRRARAHGDASIHVLNS